MTVKEFIEILSNYDNNKEVKIAATLGYADDWHEFTFEPTSEIENDDKNIFIFVEEVSDGD